MKPLLLGMVALALAGCTGAPVDPAATLDPAPAAAADPPGPPPIQVVAESPPGSIPPPRPLPTIWLDGGFSLTPEVHALVGEMVVWRNEDDLSHEIVDDAGFFVAQTIEPGAWWGHAFDAPNTYLYHCQAHPDVAGRVIVS